MPRGLRDLALGLPIRDLRAKFPKLQIQAFMQWSEVLLERLTNRTLDVAVILLPEGNSPPASFVSECVGTEAIAVLAAKAARLSQPATLEELSSYSWVMNPHGCGGRQLLETAFRQRGLPFVSTVEAEGHELQFSLISEGVGLGMARPQLVYSSALRKQLKVVRVKDFSPVHNVWLLHSRHIGRLAPAVRCVRDAVIQYLHLKGGSRVGTHGAATENEETEKRRKKTSMYRLVELGLEPPFLPMALLAHAIPIA